MPDEAAQIKQIMSELDNLVEQSTIDIALEVSDDLQRHTPKDTGYAAANWQPSVGSFSSRPVGTPGDPMPGYIAQVTGEGRVRRFTLQDGKIFIVNNAEYIGQILSNSVVGNIIGGILTRINLLGPRRR